MADPPPVPDAVAGGSRDIQPTTTAAGPGIQIEEVEGEIHITDILPPVSEEEAVSRPAHPQDAHLQATISSRVAQVGQQTIKVDYSASPGAVNVPAQPMMGAQPAMMGMMPAAPGLPHLGLQYMRPGVFSNPAVAPNRAATLDLPTPAQFLPGGELYDPNNPYLTAAERSGPTAYPAMAMQGMVPMQAIPGMYPYAPMMYGQAPVGVNPGNMPVSSAATTTTAAQLQARHNLPQVAPLPPRGTSIPTMPSAATVTATVPTTTTATAATTTTTTGAGTSGVPPKQRAKTMTATAAGTSGATGQVEGATGAPATATTATTTAATTTTATATTTAAGTSGATGQVQGATGAPATATTATTAAATTTTATATTTAAGTSGAAKAKATTDAPAKAKTAVTGGGPHKIHFTRSAAAAAAAGGKGKGKGVGKGASNVVVGEAEKKKKSLADEFEPIGEEEEHGDDEEALEGEESEDDLSPIDDDVADPSFKPKTAGEGRSSDDTGDDEEGKGDGDGKTVGQGETGGGEGDDEDLDDPMGTSRQDVTIPLNDPEFEKAMQETAANLVHGHDQDAGNEGPSDRGVAHIKDIERSLYKWVGTKPRPPVEKSEAEINIAAEDIPGNKTVRQVVAATGRICKTGSLSAMANHRGTKTLKNKIDLHSRCLVQIKDELSHMRRVLTRYDRPLESFTMATNPQLNPHLNTYVPFDSQYRVNEFFESHERVVALTRYVLHNVSWNINNFCVNAVRLICTNDYREKHQFPGKIRYEKYTYVPEVFERFFYSTANLASNRSTKGGYDREICQNQLRGAFHNSIVTRDKKRKSESEVSPSKRRYPYRGFDEDDESREEPRDGEDGEDELIEYMSYIDNSQTEDGENTLAVNETFN